MYNPLLNQLRNYHRQLSRKELWKSLIHAAIWIVCLALFLILLEYVAWFSSTIRGVFLYTFFVGSIGIVFFFLRKSVWDLLRPLGQEDYYRLAIGLGKYLPSKHADALINVLQLQNQEPDHSLELWHAAIEEKQSYLKQYCWEDFIQLKELKQPLFLFLALFALLGIGQLTFPNLFRKPSLRIWNYSFHYPKELPFEFVILNKPFQAVSGENTEFMLELRGKNVPSEVSLHWDGERIPLNPTEKVNQFKGIIPAVQEDKWLQFEAGGYFSEPQLLPVVHRPGLKEMTIQLTFPSYLKKPSETIHQAIPLKVPEGTVVRWEMTSSGADDLGIQFQNKSSVDWASLNLLRTRYQLSRTINQNSGYQVVAKNAQMPIQKSVMQPIEVIFDQKPTLQTQWLDDTLYYRFRVLNALIEDDYGLGQMRLTYQIKRKDAKNLSTKKTQWIPLQSRATRLEVEYIWRIDSLSLNPGDQVLYRVEVSDQDGLHGPKWTQTGLQIWEYPELQRLEKKMDQQVDQAEKQVLNSLQKAQNMKQEINELTKRVQLGKEVDLKALQEVLDKEAALKKTIEELKKMQEQWMGQQMSFQKVDQAWMKKMENLQKMISQLWDPDMEKRRDALLKNWEKESATLWQKHLDQMRNQGKNMERELERLQQFYQELKVEKMLDESISRWKELAKKQEELSEKNNGKNDQELAKQQEALNKEVEEERKKLDEIAKEKKEIPGEQDLDKEDQLQEEMEENLDNAEENLKNKQSKQAETNQKKAAEKMKKLAKKLEEQQEQQESMEVALNLAQLRLLMEDLLQLSFDQERIMKAYKKIPAGDLAVRQIAQEQSKLGDMASVLEDSLISLGKKLMPLSQTITKETANMKQRMQEASRMMKERKWDIVPVRQQEAMAATNQLAVLLSDLLRQVQDQAAQAKSGKKGKSKGNSKGNWGQRQQQLNQKARKMGSQPMMITNEELIKMAEEQAQIRQEMEQKMNELQGQPGSQGLQKSLSDLIKDMDKNESDIVNKRLNNSLQQRQDQMLPRLMEAEKALKEQGEDPKRESKTAVQKWKENPPPNLIPFLKRQKENRDLFQQVPVDLLPYYQQKVMQYMEKIKQKMK
ncbi:DUF4175 family protein [Aquirufa aurantiipilula]|uniref:DUF4175 family protein n=1 Tax=Aquirufa aurantiipilula TaxID=2696561 RepID=UPI001CAA5E28|nr:DUF4175 family protein [Aquirufa aurantiipilula]MBZ1327319.1 hypothetical protein [Aquirufa aurantiipilula]